MKRDKLIRARVKKGLSQEAAAGLIGVSRNTWSLWELGKEDPFPYNVGELCKFFGVKEPGELDLEPISLRREQALEPISVPLDLERIPPSLPHDTQGIMGGANEELERQDMDEVRRQLVQQTLSATGTTMIAPASLCGGVAYERS